MTEQKYILDANHNHIPVDLLTWAKWMVFENIENRRVKDEMVGKKRISTVFVGIDHDLYHKKPPLLY